jgi:hypothetical protein
MHGALCLSFGSDPAIPNRLITFVDKPSSSFLLLLFSPFSLYFTFGIFVVVNCQSGASDECGTFRSIFVKSFCASRLFSILCVCRGLATVHSDRDCV